MEGAEPAEPGVAAAFIRDAPSEVLVPLLGRLSPKCILRMHAVCTAWRDKLCSRGFLVDLHLSEPPWPLLCSDHVVYPDSDKRLKDFCIESLHLRSDDGEPRDVLRFTDYEYYQNNANGLKQALLVHGSLYGHLLVTFSVWSYVINPATRDWVSLPELTPWNMIGFYQFNEDTFSGEYRVLCRSRRVEEGVPTWWYHVLPVRRPMQCRDIGRPISPDAVDHGLGVGVDIACISPPIQSSYNRHLHWPPQASQGYHILVFDIWSEEFSWKRPPPVTNEDMRLLEFQNGDLGLSVSRKNRETLELWRLEDYENDVWVPVYQIQLALHQMPVLQDEGVWTPAVVSSEGDVLIESRHGVFHCDRNGTLLRTFETHGRVLPIRHVFRESLLNHQMYLVPRVAGEAPEPPFFLPLAM